MSIKSTAKGEIPDFLKTDAKNASVLINNAPLAIVITDQGGRIQFGNPQLERMFDYPLAELQGKPIEILIPEQLRTAHISHRTDFMDKPTSRLMGMGMDLIGRKAGGEEFPVEIGLSHIKHKNSQYIFCFISDITTRKESEELLRVSEKRFKSLFNSSPDAVILFDKFGLIQEANETGEHLFGTSQEDLVGDALSNLITDFPRSDKDRSPQGELTDLLERHLSQTYEYQAFDRGGTRFPVNVRISKLQAGITDTWIAIIRDITEQKKVERELQLLGQVVEQMKDAVILTENTPTSEIRYVNKAFSDLYGYSEEEILGQSSWILFSGDEAERLSIEEERDLSIEKEEEFRIRYQDKKKDGTKFWVSNTSSVIGFDQEKTTFDIGIIRDITKQVQFEELLSRQNQYLAALQQTSLQILSNLELTEVLESLLKQAVALLGLNHGQILTLKQDNEDYECVAGIGCFEDMITPCIENVSGFCDRFTQVNQPFILDKISIKKMNLSFDCDEEINCIMGVPLRTGDTAIGLILLAGQDNISNDPTVGGKDILNQIGQLASIAIHNAQLFNQVQQAQKESEAQKQRMENELEIARKVQLALLPQEYPALEGWSFAALWEPAREVAGDFYDFISRQDGSIDLIIADVTDKGAPAALFMAHTKGMLRKSLENRDSLVEGVSLANQVMIGENVGPFVTSFFARINPQSGEITYVNAGHDPPMLLRENPDEILHLSSTGLPLGVDLDLKYEQKTIRMDMGDLLVLYTDGVIDAINSQNHLYGHKRLLKTILENHHFNAEEMAQNLLGDIKSFIGQTTAADDIAIVVVQRH